MGIWREQNKTNPKFCWAALIFFQGIKTCFIWFSAGTEQFLGKVRVLKIDFAPGVKEIRQKNSTQ